MLTLQIYKHNLIATKKNQEKRSKDMKNYENRLKQVINSESETGRKQCNCRFDLDLCR